MLKFILSPITPSLTLTPSPYQESKPLPRIHSHPKPPPQNQPPFGFLVRGETTPLTKNPKATWRQHPLPSPTPPPHPCPKGGQGCCRIFGQATFPCPKGGVRGGRQLSPYPKI